MPRPEAICHESGVYLSDCRCKAVLSISKGMRFPHCCDRRDKPTNWTFHRPVGGWPSGETGGAPPIPRRKR